MKQINKVVKSGFSLMEMVIVVIIIGILLGAVTKMTSATKSAKVTTLMQGFQNLATAAIQYQNENDGSYENIAIKGTKKAPGLIEMGILGQDWDKGAKAKNPFAGGFTIKSLEKGNAFGIKANGIPTEICSKIAAHKYKVPGADAFTCDKGVAKATYGTSNLKAFK